jgi:Ca2+-binding EF-hand superfamily protein
LLPINGIIGESLLRIIGKELTFETISAIMQTFYSGTLKERIELVYNMFDTNRDGQIAMEDVRLLLSHIPCEKAEDANSLNATFNAQEEIFELIGACFKNKDTLTVTDFSAITIDECSDIFIAVYSYIDFSVYKEAHALH